MGHVGLRTWSGGTTTGTTSCLARQGVKATTSIQGVEARVTYVLNEHNSALPFSKRFDETKSMKEVKQIAGQFTVS